MSAADNPLIAEFNARHNEDAFAALVRQHINLVYGTALRQVGDGGAAEEIAQNVFVALAQSCDKLGGHPTIAGWLYRTTLNKSREWLRGELRRRHREQVAFNLESIRAEGDSVWSQMVPLLDEALLKLSEPDRLAVIMHYMEGRGYHEVGSALGISDEGARKRVSRCLDELALFYCRRGFAVPAAASVAPLFALSSHAPVGLAVSATSAALAAVQSAASTSALTFLKGSLKIMAWTKSKAAIVAGAGILLASSTTTLIVFRHDIGDHFARAGGRRAIAEHRAMPVQLAAYYQMGASNFDESKTGYYAWGCFPRGFQVFNHVPFQIDGEFSLYGKANAQELHMLFPEQITGIEINQKFETLYLLHNSFYMAPKHTPVFGVVFHYEDDSAVTNELLFGDDVLGWVVSPAGPKRRAHKKAPSIGPTGPNSRLAWAGGAWSVTDKSPMRLCMTAVANPLPLSKVVSIDLYSCKSRCAPCIFAITAGESGLMQ